jgi:hypothetical protein
MEADQLYNLSLFVQGLELDSLCTLLTELESDPRPYADYFDINKKDWLQLYGPNSNYVFNYIYDYSIDHFYRGQYLYLSVNMPSH